MGQDFRILQDGYSNPVNSEILSGLYLASSFLPASKLSQLRMALSTRK